MMKIKELFFLDKKIAVSFVVNINQKGSSLKQYVLSYIEKTQKVVCLIYKLLI